MFFRFILQQAQDEEARAAAGRSRAAVMDGILNVSATVLTLRLGYLPSQVSSGGRWSGLRKWVVAAWIGFAHHAA